MKKSIIAFVCLSALISCEKKMTESEQKEYDIETAQIKYMGQIDSLLKMDNKKVEIDSLFNASKSLNPSSKVVSVTQKQIEYVYK